MNNKLIIIETPAQKQINFMKEIKSPKRDKAKKILLQQLNKAQLAIIDLKVDILAHNINVSIFDIENQDTDDYFQRLKKIIGYVDFILEKEIQCIIDIAQEPTEEDIKEMEKDRKTFEYETKEGVITCDY